jgi:hypothetical protein
MTYRETVEGEREWPPILGLYDSQARIATISRAIDGITPLLQKLLMPYVPTADELDGQKQYIVDGPLLPCWSRAGHRESGALPVVSPTTGWATKGTSATA